mmetsp:Transcript_7913/g.16022  ORF Transcript_7913/g.16022 Transcript_7913/m.16022 type:complete len:271 (-) Transcript_7913:427-1239(-)
METAKKGHTVEFKGLKGAAHLNGTQGTLVEFLKREHRWRVRCDADGVLVNARPENLELQRLGVARPVIGGDISISAARARGLLPDMSVAASTGGLSPPVHANAWANGLPRKDQYEWFSNCYQMRCDDDYQWGGGYLHGPYDPEATPQSIADDFLVFCILALRADAVPSGWTWKAYLGAAAKYIPFAFEKSDAKERWGGENYFQAQMGGRSLRYTAQEIYKSQVDRPGNSDEHRAAEEDAEGRRVEFIDKLGGAEAWMAFVADIGRSRRFA